MAHATGSVYPTTLDTATTLGQVVDGTDYILDEDHNESRKAIIALERKVGADTSTDTASLDYKLRQVEAGPNIIVNAGFEVNTRAASSYTGGSGGVECLDRWTLISDVSTFTGAPDTATVDAKSGQSLKLTYTYAAGGYGILRQIIEGFAQYKGQALTLSLRVNPNKVGALIIQLYDGVGSTTSSANTTTTWETLTVTHTVSASATLLHVYAYMTSAGTSVMYLDNTTLGVGTVPPVYRPENKAIEIERCQRFVEIHGFAPASGAFPMIDAYDKAGGIAASMIAFNTEKVGVPTMTSTGTWTTVNTADTKPNLSGITHKGYKIYVTSTALARTLIYPDSATDLITAEYNL